MEFEKHGLADDGAGLDTTSDTETVNGLLQQWRDGSQEAYQKLIVFLYDDLRLIAHRQFQRERGDHTLQTGDLVSKLYLKLLNSKNVPWEDHQHFLRTAARTMRQILIDHARSWGRRADGQGKVEYQDVVSGGNNMDEDGLSRFLTIHEAIEKMERLDPTMARIADLRLTLGLTLEETARALKIPINRAKREWLMIRKFMAQTLRTNEAQD